MKVKKIRNACEPGYPSGRQFKRYGAMLGAAALGLTAITSGCKPEPPPLGGVIVVDPTSGASVQPPPAALSGAVPSTGVDTSTVVPVVPGEIRVDPPPRFRGEPPMEPITNPPSGQ